MVLEEEKGFESKDVLPEQFIGLEDLPRRVMHAQRSGGLEGIRKLIVKERSLIEHIRALTSFTRHVMDTNSKTTDGER